MSAIEVLPIRSSRDRRTFLTFPWKIYAGDPLWVPPLIPQRSKTIDPRHGAFFKRGEVDFFIAWRDGEAVGTIAAAEDPPTNALRKKHECMFGFFEYIDDDEVADALVKRVIQWARERGLDMLYGPFNLDYEDSYGVLLEGRDRPPTLLCGHSPPYYSHFMDRYGFQPARGDNIALAIHPDSPQLPRLSRVAGKLRSRGRITVRGANLAQFQEEVDRVHFLLNASLAHLPDHMGWQRDAVEATLTQFRTIADPELVLFAEVAGEAVGWLAGIPDLNEHFIHVNGLRRPWDYLNLWRRMRHQPSCLCLKSIAVLPQYWNRGVGIVLLDELTKRALAKGYQWADLSLTSEDNPNTPILAEHLGAKIYKRYRIYKLEIERKPEET
jgi:GNAT superfamily N-acetyltransferase